MFGEECVDFTDKNCLALSVDGKTAFINLETRVSIILREAYTQKCYGKRSLRILVCFYVCVQTVVCEEDNSEEDSFREMVELSVQRLYEAVNPVMWDGLLISFKNSSESI